MQLDSVQIPPRCAFLGRWVGAAVSPVPYLPGGERLPVVVCATGTRVVRVVVSGRCRQVAGKPAYRVTSVFLWVWLPLGGALEDRSGGCLR